MRLTRHKPSAAILLKSCLARPNGDANRENMPNVGLISLKAKLPAVHVGISLLVAAVVGFQGYYEISNLAADHLAERISTLAWTGK